MQTTCGLETMTFQRFTYRVVEIATKHGNPIIEGGENMFRPGRKGCIELNLSWRSSCFDNPSLRMRTSVVSDADGVKLHKIHMVISRGGCATLIPTELKPYIEALQHIEAFCNEIAAMMLSTFLVPEEPENDLCS